MAEAGERFDMPEGSSYIVRTPTDATGGEYVEMEFVLPDGCVPPPPHVHPDQIESYEVIEGTFEVMVDGEWMSLSPGESASVPRGVMQTFRNRSAETVRVRNWHRPAKHFEDFIERMHSALGEAGIRRRRDPRIFICLSAVMLEYPETLIPARTRDRVPMELLALLGRILNIPRGSR